MREHNHDFLSLLEVFLKCEHHDSEFSRSFGCSDKHVLCLGTLPFRIVSQKRVENLSLNLIEIADFKLFRQRKTRRWLGLQI